MIKVTADSTCDLSREILDEMNITLMNMSAAFYTRRRQCFTVAAEKFDTCGGGI